MVEGYNWGEIYEYTFSEHVAIAIVAFNELKWLNDYHAEVQKNLLPLLAKDPKAATFLKTATTPIQKAVPVPSNTRKFKGFFL